MDLRAVEEDLDAVVAADLDVERHVFCGGELGAKIARGVVFADEVVESDAVFDGDRAPLCIRREVVAVEGGFEVGGGEGAADFPSAHGRVVRLAACDPLLGDGRVDFGAKGSQSGVDEGEARLLGVRRYANDRWVIFCVAVKRGVGGAVEEREQ